MDQTQSALTTHGGAFMNDEKQHKDPEVPKGQKLFDNIWLLFLLSLAISTVLYNIWGLIDLARVPLAP